MRTENRIPTETPLLRRPASDGLARFSRGVRAVLAAAGPMALAACASGPDFAPTGGAVRVDGAAVGSRYDGLLGRSDLAALESAFGTALAGPAERASWRGDRARGEILLGAHVLGGLDLQDPRWPETPPGLALEFPVETDLGLHALTSNANVRSGPSTSYRVLETMKSGDAVDVIGRVAGGRWMLVEAYGRVRGYIHESLMVRQPGAELELAGGPTRTPAPCRRFDQRLEVDGRNDSWSGVVCNEGGRWRVEPPPPDAPMRLY